MIVVERVVDLLSVRKETRDQAGSWPNNMPIVFNDLCIPVSQVALPLAGQRSLECCIGFNHGLDEAS